MKGLTIAAATRETLTLRWQPPSGVGVDGYEISQGEAGRDMALIAVVPGTVFIAPGLNPATRYRYRVQEIRLEDFVPSDDDDVEVMRTSGATLPELEFPDRVAFFREFLAPTFARARNATPWCQEWQQHEESFWLMGELWNSYEASRPADPPAPPDGGRMSWAVHYAYPALDRLFLPDGTFKGCKQENADLEGGTWHKPQARPLPG